MHTYMCACLYMYMCVFVYIDMCVYTYLNVSFSILCVLHSPFSITLTNLVFRTKWSEFEYIVITYIRRVFLRELVELDAEIYNSSPAQQTNLPQIFPNLNCILVSHKDNVANAPSRSIFLPFPSSSVVPYFPVSSSTWSYFQWCLAAFFCQLKYSLETSLNFPFYFSLWFLGCISSWDQIL